MEANEELAQLKKLLASTGMGTWKLIVQEGKKPQLLTDSKMKELMGLPPDSDITPEDACDMLLQRIHPDDQADFAAYDEMLKRGERSEITYRWIHPTLGERYVRCGGIVVPTEKGIILNGYHYDITEQKLKEIKRKKQLADNIAANEAKTRFIQNMSHEIRTPLNALFGFAQLLGYPEGTWTKEEREEFNFHINNSYNMLDLLISDILDSADSEHGNYRIKLSQISVNEICRNAIMTVEFRRPAIIDLRFTTDFSDDHMVTSDGRRIQQVLVNYLTNACKNTSEGEIHLHCSSTENSGKVTFSVTDTGKGVPPEKADEIFGRFTKLDQHVQGSGLGLNICNTIAQKLGGEVYLDTTHKGVGARFVFVIDDKL